MFIGLGIFGCATKPVDSISIIVVEGRVLDQESNFPLENIKVFFIDTGYDDTLSKKPTPIEIGHSNARGKIAARINYWWERKKPARNPPEATFDIVLSGESYISQRFQFKESELKTDGLTFLVDLKDVHMARKNE